MVICAIQEDIEKLQGHSHSLMAETVSYELKNILESTEVCVCSVNTVDFLDFVLVPSVR